MEKLQYKIYRMTKLKNNHKKNNNKKVKEIIRKKQKTKMMSAANFAVRNYKIL